jgi:hypothetical protein
MGVDLDLAGVQVTTALESLPHCSCPSLAGCSSTLAALPLTSSMQPLQRARANEERLFQQT